MAKEKIAILGGGMAGLTAAYHLSRTQQLRERFDVTVYQMGWRLGGKATSGRDGPYARNIEHGLHVWFGYYENAFRLLREVYDNWTPPVHCPLQSWTDVFKPQAHTGVGMLLNGSWQYCSLDWPMAAGVPGDGGLPSPLWGSIALLADTLFRLVKGAFARAGQDLKLPSIKVDWGDFRAAAYAGYGPRSLESKRAEALAAAPPTLGIFAETAKLWAGALQLIPVPKAVRAAPLVALVGAIDFFVQRTRSAFIDDVAAQMLADTTNILAATLRGMVADLIVPDKSFESIDDVEFRDWLIKHGADKRIVETCSLVRIAYDISFQYVDGDVTKPNCAAGSTLGSFLRMLAGHKGAMMYEVQSGFGEGIVVPLYRVLEDRGVKFEFFHKVRRLELSDNKRRVERVHFDIQARPKKGKYRPTILVNDDTIECWPSEPDWSQLEDGPRADFESHWCDAKPAAERTISYKDIDDTAPNEENVFSRVVLAITLAAYKKLNNKDEGICDELIAGNDQFRSFTEAQGIVPTASVQLWCDKTLEGLGWKTGKSAAVSGPEYINIWADMSQILALESWPPGRKPQSLHYLLGTFKTQLHKAPAASTDTPALARALLSASVANWLSQQSIALWPAASDGRNFSWNVLHDPKNGKENARLDAQIVRANINPTECCVATHAGTTKYRLYPHESGFSNLVLAGEATRHGLNATAIEGAVMSGKAAAAVISGEKIDIPGYDFLSSPISKVL